MIIIKTTEQIDILREGGKRLATILYKVKDKVAPGISTKELDMYAEKLIREGGDTPAFLNYRPSGVRVAYPASLCTSVNEEVVHGIPNKNKILKEGDIISIDLGLKHKGLFTDMALTVPVGKINKEELMENLKNKIWQYSRRQMTWWRKNKNIIWLKVEELQKIKETIRKFL
jgi:methionyl aminopeptidase